jgi:phosphomannomutase
LVDEKGNAVNPSLVTALIANRELQKKPGSPIIYNLISSRAVREVVEEKGGKPLRSRVGHSYIKAMMAEAGAIFGGEHSGHFFFRFLACRFRDACSVARDSSITERAIKHFQSYLLLMPAISPVEKSTPRFQIANQ